MTYREHYAGLALQGILANPSAPRAAPELVARLAVEQAQAVCDHLGLSYNAKVVTELSDDIDALVSRHLARRGL